MRNTLVERDDRHRRAGRWSAKVGPAKSVARVNGVSERRQQQINAGSPKGWVQDAWDHITAVAKDSQLRATALLEGMEQEIIRARRDDTRGWLKSCLERCRRESTVDAQVDLLQMELRTDPNNLTALRSFVEVADQQLIELRELVCAAKARLETTVQ